MSECKHGISESSCTICSGSDAVTPLIALRTIAARYEAKCPGCGEKIEPGDEISVTEDEEWYCGSCVEPVYRRELRRQARP